MEEGENWVYEWGLKLVQQDSAVRWMDLKLYGFPNVEFQSQTSFVLGVSQMGYSTSL